MFKRVYRFLLTTFFLTLSVVSFANAQDAPNIQAKKVQDAWNAALAVSQKGPVTITLKQQGTLKVPSGMFFVKQPEASNFMVAIGNSSDIELVGLVFSTSKDQEWITTIDYTASGYIRDGDAKEWKSDTLLASLKEGTEQSNKRRVEQGYPALEILNWVEEPNYNAQTHRLVWSLLAQNKGAASDGLKTINYNTYALGREGYFALNLITSDKAIAAEKQHAIYLLESLSFNDGKKYADFNETTDKVATYGLTALVGGGLIAKKLGLFALIGAFLLKGWKLILIGLVFAGGGISRFFGRKSE